MRCPRSTLTTMSGPRFPWKRSLRPLTVVSFVHQAAALGDGVRTAHSINSPPKVSIFMGTLLLGRDSTAIEVARCRSGRLGGTGLYVSDLHREPRNVTAGAVATARHLGTPMR